VHGDTEAAEGVGRHAPVICVLGVHFWRCLLLVRVGWLLKYDESVARRFGLDSGATWRKMYMARESATPFIYVEHMVMEVVGYMALTLGCFHGRVKSQSFAIA